MPPKLRHNLWETCRERQQTYLAANFAANAPDFSRAGRPSLDITDCCKNSSVESSDLVRRGLSQAGPLLHRVGTRWGVRHWVWAVGHWVGRASTHQGAIVAGGVVGLHRLDLALGVRVPSCCPRLSTRGQIHRDHLVEVALLAARGGRPGHRLPLHLGGQGT